MIDKLVAISSKIIDVAGNGGKILLAQSDNIKKGAAVITSGLGIATAIKKFKNAFKKDTPKAENNIENTKQNNLDSEDSEKTVAVTN